MGPPPSSRIANLCAIGIFKCRDALRSSSSGSEVQNIGFVSPVEKHETRKYGILQRKCPFLIAWRLCQRVHDSGGGQQVHGRWGASLKNMLRKRRKYLCYTDEIMFSIMPVEARTLAVLLLFAHIARFAEF